jgi:NAD-dependent glycerol-3-phosphate dehydrogenase C-terminus
MGTDAYRAEVTDDDTGVEICAPMKNVYAIALGLADGLEQCHGEPFHNLKSAVFAQAVRELGLLCRMVGGRAETAVGLTGAGDLEVTGLSGRNKVYGARIGRGERAPTALEAMTAAEQTVEGVPAARHAKDLVDQRDAAGWPSFPLLTAILGVIDDAPDPVGRVIEAVLPPRGAPGRLKAHTYAAARSAMNARHPAEQHRPAGERPMPLDRRAPPAPTARRSPTSSASPADGSPGGGPSGRRAGQPLAQADPAPGRGSRAPARRGPR